MTHEELQQILHREPFSPVRIHMADGRRFDLIRPDLALLTQRWIHVGFEYKRGSGIAGRTVFCYLPHIARVESLSAGRRRRTSRN